jgi:hypothetical protein
MAQKNQETEIAVQVTRPNGTTGEMVVDAPQAWTAGTVLEFVHQQLRALLPKTEKLVLATREGGLPGPGRER